MAKDMLVIRVKNRLKTEKCLEIARSIEEHLEDEYSVLLLDKNVAEIEWFERPKEAVIEPQDDNKIDEELGKTLKEKEK